MLQRYWLNKLGSISFRFILRLPNQAKPTAFLRRIGKPDYVHVVANGESWVFTVGGDAQSVWDEAHRAGYELIAGDIAGDTPEELREYLGHALCLEREPLNTRRKISHSRGLFTEPLHDISDDESKQKTDPVEESKGVNAVCGKKSVTWDSEVVMRPIEEIAGDLEKQG